MSEFKSEISSLLNKTITKTDIETIRFLYGGKVDLCHILWSIASEDEQPVSWRAAWVLEHISADEPNVLKPYLNDIYGLLRLQTHQGMKRQLFNLVLRFPPNEYQIETLLNKALDWLNDPKEAIAVRANAVRFVMAVYKIEPAFKNEFLEIMRLQLNNTLSTWLENIILKSIKKLEK